MEQNDLAIRLRGVKKQYRLGAISGRTLQRISACKRREEAEFRSESVKKV